MKTLIGFVVFLALADATSWLVKRDAENRAIRNCACFLTGRSTGGGIGHKALSRRFQEE